MLSGLSACSAKTQIPTPIPNNPVFKVEEELFEHCEQEDIKVVDIKTLQLKIVDSEEVIECSHRKQDALRSSYNAYHELLSSR